MNPQFAHPVGGPAVVRQRIRLEPTDSRVLFALRPVMNTKAPEGETAFLEPFDGSISRSDSNSRRPFEHEMTSALDHTGPSPASTFPKTTPGRSPTAAGRAVSSPPNCWRFPKPPSG